jgi:peptidyl-prolyl cis-trans isomerase B (cyclophilin B)
MTTQAIITMEDGGRIVLELDPGQAPQTVANFKALADQHFYDGLIFHRVIRGFMIQGGCPQGTGTGGPGYQIKGEFRANGVNNQIRHERGVISMARAMDPNSAGSQFFIMHQAAPHLDGQYAAFGKVREGMDVVDRIAAARTGRQDRPLDEQKIRSIVVEETGSQAGGDPDGQAGAAIK